jgi:F0F1-type ATP synthase assembly protein I
VNDGDGDGDHESGTLPEQVNSTMKDLPGAMALLAMGMTVALILAVFVVLGIWADRAWGTAPWGLLIGIALGTVAAVVSVVKQVRRFL